MQALLTIARAVYETPAVTALGPELAALTAGFAVFWMGEVHITPLGEEYLASLPTED